MGGRLPGGACIPPLLESWKHKILLAGKYLNVIRECGIDMNKGKAAFDEDLSMDDEKLVALSSHLFFANLSFTGSMSSSKTLIHMQIRPSYNCC